MIRYSGVLILGPTGVGKTPLGAYCENKGLWGSRVFHFDFGALLRRVDAAGAGACGLSARDIAVAQRSLKTGALLENRDVHIALNILRFYAAERCIQPSDLVLLNGLPRHQGQAADIAPFVKVKCVIELFCTPDIINERIRLNTGGDRNQRKDDSTAAVAKRLAIFRKQTAPLLLYYRRKGVPILPVAVEIDTSPAQAYQALVRHSGLMQATDR